MDGLEHGVALPSAPLCAQHPPTAAVGPCNRCGTFGCKVCLRQHSALGLACADCRARVGEDVALAWLNANLPLHIRFAKTCFQIVRHPAATFAGLPRGRLREALFFSALVQVLSCGVDFAVFLAQHRELPNSAADWGDAGLNDLQDAIALPPSLAIAVFSAARLLGAKTSLIAVLHALLYMQAPDLIWFAARPFGPRFSLAVAVPLTFVSMSLSGIAIAAFGRGRLGLSPVRARWLVTAWLCATIIGSVVLREVVSHS